MSVSKTVLNRRTLLASAVALTAARALPAAAKAPLLGVADVPFHRYKIGAFEITAINDGLRVADAPSKIYGVNQSPEDVAKFAEANHLPADRLLNGFTPIIVNTGSELVLFDTGNGAGGRPDVGRLTERMKEAGYAPDQVDVVVVTHCHPDHIGGLMENGAPAFPNARYVIGEVEFDFWSKPERLSGPTERAAKVTQSNVVPLKEKFTFAKDGQEAVAGIRAIEAFGHTPGHLAWHIESDGKRLLLGADFANHYVLSVARPDWHVSFDSDKELAVSTRKRLLDMIATDRIPFTSYHMPFPAVGF